MAGPNQWGPYNPYQQPGAPYGGPPQGGYRPGGPPPGYGYAYGYGPPPRPPRRSGGFGVLVAVLMGFGAIVAVGGVLTFQLLGSDGSDNPTPASSPPASAPPSHGTNKPGTGKSVAVANPLYKVGALHARNCRGHRIVAGDPASFKAFLESTSDCLDKAWGQALARGDIPFEAPERVFWTHAGRSPCGDYPSPGVAAFYCPANNAMYIGIEHAQEAAGGLPVRYNVAYARELAHEYAHHIQDEAGILTYSHRARSSASSTDKRNGITRRTELQAQCLAGVFMHSIRRTFPITAQQWRIALKDSYGRGDDRRPPSKHDHGTNAHYRGWLQTGYKRGVTSVCNTWKAPPSDVA